MVDPVAARQAMVDCQIRPSDVTNYAVIEAMLWAPREIFVPHGRREVAYAEAEVELAPGRALLMPRTLAKMIEAADIGSGDLVLDLCPGTGYSTALLARMAEVVVAVEPDATLAARAETLLAELEVDNAVVSTGDPALGDREHGPYDVVFLNGSVERVPDALVDQIKQGGRLVTIMQSGATGHCHRMVRAGEGVSSRAIFDADGPLLPGFAREKQFTF
ncbi:MAG: protein-L-isoaspartate O-methyltransferase [Pseudomonadota bacterium]